MVKQPKRKIIEKKHPDKKIKIKKEKIGTSKLEDKFAHEFLDKLGVKYTRQFKAETIGRYYDFFLNDCHLLIEIDGDYYHSYGKVYEEMSPMQKKNKRVDKEKDRWAMINCMPLIRIWEHDINHHPEKVMEMLKREIGYSKERKDKQDNKKIRH